MSGHHRFTETRSVNAETTDHPIRRGLHTARTIAPAGAVLLCVAVSILLGYHYVPAVTRALDAVAAFKLRSGFLFAVIATPIFGAVLPIAVQQTMPRTRTDAAWRKLPYLIGFWAFKGAEVDLLYRLQAWAFGDNAALGTIMIKVFIDQFVYCPIWALPSTVLGYAVTDYGYNPRRMLRELGRGWYRRMILPLLVANWFVWVPAVAVIYCLKLPLQLPIQNLVLCLWSILLLVVVRKPVTRPRRMIDD